MKVNIFMPKYMADFKCIAGDCKDTCCAGWDINIDEDSYNKYIKSSGNLKEIVQGKFIKNEREHDYFNHGFMILKGESRCPFLNDDMLCDIHGGAGEENLCITCKNYPRVFNIVDDVYEKSGLPSCEEICRKALLNKEKMEFIEAEDEIDEDCIEIRRIIDSEAFEGSSSLIQYFWEIRIASINIMQNRNFSIEERLNILENFYNELEEISETDDFETIEDIIDEFSNEEEYAAFKGAEFKEDLDLYLNLAGEKVCSKIRSVRFKKVIKKYKNGILNEEGELKNDIFNSIKKCSEDIREYDYIFENYIVNNIFKGMIPFNKISLKESFDELSNVYKILKAYVTGAAVNEGDDFNGISIIEIIQAFSKDNEHNNVFRDILVNKK